MALPKRDYLDNTAGQLHVWQWQGGESALPAIVCLPPVPYGGRFFDSFAQAYDGSVWSADLPGYGFSDALVDPPTVAGYTHAMTPLLNAPGTAVWLVGFHSGALVAIEMANHYPDQVSGLVLVDVPVFSGPEVADLRGSLTKPPAYLEQEDPLNGLFKAMVADRLDRVAYPRALDLFFDFVGAGEARNAGYHAAANFEAEPAAAQVAQPALVIATHSSLREGTLQVAEWLPQATLVERDDITMPAFELGAEPIAELTRDFVG
ncbi:MAG: alpha/beta fold hydrolase [Luminiphilus sp.]